MKIIGTADVHAHNYRDFDRRTDKSGSQRLDNILEVFNEMLSYALANDVKLMFVSGDLFHIRNGVNTVVFNEVHDHLLNITKQGIEIVMIPGNHDDSAAIDNSPHSLHPLKSIPGVTIIDEIMGEKIYNIDGKTIHIHGLRYTKDVGLVKHLVKQTTDKYKDSDDTHILLAHLGIQGGLAGSGHSMPDGYILKDIGVSFFDFIALGHFHRPQKLGGYQHAFYCGSPVQHDFGEEHNDNGFVVMDLESNTSSIYPLYKLPKFVTIELENDEDCVTKIEEIEKDSNNYYKFKLKDDVMPTFKRMISTLPNLQYKLELTRTYKVEERVPIRIGMKFEEIVTKYAEEYNPEATEMGLEILSKVRGS